jgi:hypothetical protein
MLFLHIGCGKAGSTTIQQSLLESQDILAQHDIVLPEISKAHGGNCAPLAMALHSKVKDRDRTLEQFENLFALPLSRKIVISSEFLLGLSSSAIADFRQLIGKRDIQVIVYIREYSNWFQSLYGQASRTGKNLTNFDLFFARRWTECSVTRYLSRWADVFGWNSIRVRSLDPQCLTGGTLLADFSSILGVTLRPIENKNLARHWIEIEFLRELYRANPKLRTLGSKHDINYAANHLRRLLADMHVEPAQYLTLRQWKLLQDLYRQDVAVIQREVSTNIPGPSEVILSERPYLPTLLRAPEDLCERFSRAVCPPAFWSGRNSDVRKAVSTAVANWSGRAVSDEMLEEAVHGNQLFSL